MVHLLLAAGLVGAAAPAADLEALAAALGGSSWVARFEQSYTPAGFGETAPEGGTMTLSPPLRLRFDYAGPPPRAFATDGTVVRMVDPASQTCDAFRLDRALWGRMPLAALLDPGAARAVFAVSREGPTWRLTPREPSPDLAELLVTVGADGMPSGLTVTDAGGNGNRFSFSQWRRVADPPDALFHPALDGAAPCAPPEE